MSIGVGIVFLVAVFIFIRWAVAREAQKESNWEGSPVLPSGFSECFITADSDPAILRRMVDSEAALNDLISDLKRNGPRVGLIRTK